MNTKTTYHTGSGMRLLLACAGLSSAAQDQDQRTASPTRPARPRQRRKNAPKAKVTIDNDNLGTLTGTVNVVGEAACPAADRPRLPQQNAEDRPGREGAGQRTKPTGAKNLPTPTRNSPTTRTNSTSCSANST